MHSQPSLLVLIRCSNPDSGCTDSPQSQKLDSIARRIVSSRCSSWWLSFTAARALDVLAMRSSSLALDVEAVGVGLDRLANARGIKGAEVEGVVEVEAGASGAEVAKGAGVATGAAAAFLGFTTARGRNMAIEAG